MTVRRKLFPALAALAVSCAFAGTAANASGIDVAKSEIAFTMKQMGARFDGRFRQWKADVDFDPKSLATSKAVIDVDLGSVDLASDESDTAAKGSLWFDTARFPVAHFASTAIRDLGANRYEVTGRLTLKGIAHDCTVPLAVATDATGTRVAAGTFSLRRLDYRIGEGEWADTGVVDNDILVRVRMVLAPPT